MGECLLTGKNMFPVPISNGGTGDITASGALTNLGIPMEYGTWTPTLGTSATAPTVTYYHQYGYYYRIGGLVYITCEISCDITDVGSGGACINSLPYTSKSTYVCSLTRTYNGGIADGTDDGGRIQPNNTYILITDSTGTMSVVWKTGAGYIGFSGCYLKA